ncbi:MULTISPECIES: DUF2155 domain-containing protein [Mameliella]|uniref:DUF2155 domain-containing protein n=2 Tax=Roseobacteraceae TaxID=2854170 RepID=A0A0B3S3X9_9RHOB|nr:MULTISPECIES: DUF2155 domain-containing protein [Mameliella]MBV6635016.1 DUF2155 domain-containing protein [Mameliella sp.]ODM50528.1 hypothetical protein A9320_01985 [Ruegeria sp. PBVC088]KHQ51396.1 hypothetical protein OA50_03891 [Mameliella alba]MBY6118226.1 DUF2155 domain-containing protein [Mameliella alba]MDD9732990.1 DUF2155 domain-containing protein [Mameliella sp. AT18]
MIARALAVMLALTAPALAQEQTETGTGAVLRGLDKLNAKVSDITLQNGEATVLGLIEIALKECRYPQDDPSGDAYAFLTIREAGVAKPLFSGWMIASSPALNAMDHARYDVWVMRCTLPE